jgi:hypothetical protein
MEHEHDEVEEEDENEFDLSHISGIQADKSFATLTSDILKAALAEDDTQ